MYRPGGMSSDEDWDDDDDYYPRNYDPPPLVNRFQPTISIHQQFLDAVSDKDVAKARELLSSGADVNYKPDNNWTALIQASSYGHYELVKLLIEHGADVNCSHEKTTPVIAVCKSTNNNENELLECLDVLVASGAECNVSDWYRISALSHAVKQGRERLVVKLLENKADINEIDQEGWSPIFYAVEKGNLDLVKFLKNNGADIYLSDRQQQSLLDIALEREYFEIVKFLSGGIEVTPFYEKEEPGVKVSTVQRIMSESPQTEDRLSGFQQDIFKILTAVQLGHLCGLFIESNIELGHLLTIGDNKLKKIGVKFNFERRKILRTVERFHEFPWCMSSFGDTVSQKGIDLFQIAQTVATMTRQMYIINVTSYWWVRQGGLDRQIKGLPDDLKTGLKTIKLLRSKIKSLQSIIQKIDKQENIISSDLILPQKETNSWQPLLVIAGSTAVSCIIILTYKYKFS